LDINILSSTLEQLKEELVSQSLWLYEEPDETKFRSTAPFCCDTMDFHEWLQFVFIPKMNYMIENEMTLPSKLAIAPMGEVVYRNELQKREKLIKILQKIDSLFM